MNKLKHFLRVKYVKWNLNITCCKRKKKKEIGNWKSGKRHWHIKSTFLGVKYGKWNSTGSFFFFLKIFIFLVENFVEE